MTRSGWSQSTQNTWYQSVIEHWFCIGRWILTSSFIFDRIIHGASFLPMSNRLVLLVIFWRDRFSVPKRVYCPSCICMCISDIQYLKVYSKFILRGWPQRQQETLYPYTRGLLHGWQVWIWISGPAIPEMVKWLVYVSNVLASEQLVASIILSMLYLDLHSVHCTNKFVC